MTNETIATETTEAVGEFPIDELLSDGTRRRRSCEPS